MGSWETPDFVARRHRREGQGSETAGQQFASNNDFWPFDRVSQWRRPASRTRRSRLTLSRRLCGLRLDAHVVHGDGVTAAPLMTTSSSGHGLDAAASPQSHTQRIAKA